MTKPLRLWPLLAALGFLVLLWLLMPRGDTELVGPVAHLPYSEFKTRVNRGEVATAVLAGERISGELTVPVTTQPGGRQTNHYRTRVPTFGDPDLLPLLEAQDVEVRVVEEPADGFGSMLLWLLPWLLILGIWTFMWRRMTQGPFGGGLSGGRDIKTFLEGSSTKEEKAGKRVTFADVAGQDNAKREVAELVDYLRDRLAVMLAGRAAEKALIGSVSSGADDDISQATKLARAMVSRWGMSEDVGPVDVRESEEHPFLGREMAQPRRFSEATAEAADKAVRQLLTEAENRASEALLAHRQRVERLVSELERHETLDRTAIERCLGQPGTVTEMPAKTTQA